MPPRAREPTRLIARRALTGKHSERQTFAFTAPLSGFSALVDLFAHVRDAVRRHEGR